MKKRKLHLESSKIAYFIFVGIALVELVASIASVAFATSPDIRDAGISNIFLSILAMILFSVPWFIEARYKVDIPNLLEILVLSFVFSSIVLGNIHNFLANVEGYDKFLHTVSGITISIIAFEVVHLYNISKTAETRMNPLLVGIFAFTFSMTLLVLWEFYEFSIDTIAYQISSQTSRNMQRYQWVNLSTFFPQDYGLLDTMLDLIVGAIGAAIVSIIGWKILARKAKQKIKEDSHGN